MALAAGTDSGVQINNTATVNYTVSGVAQAAIGSSPTGNSVGAGSPTQFVVDNKVNLTVTRVGLAQTPVAAGQTNQTVVYRLENIGNTTQGYTFTAANLTGDNFDMTNFRVRVSADTTCALNSTTPPAGGYASATDTADFVQTLAEDTCRWVYIVADTPAGRANGDLSNVTLTATTVVAGAANAGAAVVVLQTAGADTAGTVDVVFADPARNGLETAQGTYVVSTAALSVQKTSSVFSDPFNNTTNPKAIPGAVMEYAIALTNSGGANATVVTITDAVPANTTFLAGQYNGSASDVSITVGAGAPTFCVAEAGGADTNADGCFRTSANGTLTVGAPAVSAVATGGAATRVTVRFRVTIL